MKSILNKKEIRQDPMLRWIMWAGLPIAVIAVAALWLGQTLGSPGLGVLFVITMPIALVLGLAYNVRYMILANRARNKDKQ